MFKCPITVNNITHCCTQCNDRVGKKHIIATCSKCSLFYHQKGVNINIRQCPSCDRKLKYIGISPHTRSSVRDTSHKNVNSFFNDRLSSQNYHCLY